MVAVFDYAIGLVVVIIALLLLSWTITWLVRETFILLFIPEEASRAGVLGCIIALGIIFCAMYMPHEHIILKAWFVWRLCALVAWLDEYIHDKLTGRGKE